MSTNEDETPVEAEVTEEEPVLNREQRRALKSGKKLGARAGAVLNPDTLRGGSAHSGSKGGHNGVPRTGTNKGR